MQGKVSMKAKKTSTNDPSKSRIKGRPKKTTKQTLQPMLMAGMTEREIAKATDKAKTTVHAAIHREFSQEELDSWKVNEADALRAFRLSFIQAIDQDKIKGMIERRGLVDYGIAYDKEMLERGHSPSTRPVLVIVKGGNTQINVDKGPGLPDNDVIEITSEPDRLGMGSE